MLIYQCDHGANNDADPELTTLQTLAKDIIVDAAQVHWTLVSNFLARRSLSVPVKKKKNNKNLNKPKTNFFAICQIPKRRF